MYFSSLRSPGFHLQRHHEALLKAKKLFERKQKYKALHDECNFKLQEYEAKVGKLQDLATGTAQNFSEAMAKLSGSAADANKGAVGEATMGIELKHMEEKMALMRENLKSASANIEAHRIELAAAKAELANKDVEVARAYKDVELAKLVAGSDANAKLAHEHQAFAKLEGENKSQVNEIAKLREMLAAAKANNNESQAEDMAALKEKLLVTEAALKEKAEAYELKDKEYATLAWEYSKVNNMQGEMSQEAEAKLKEVRCSESRKRRASNISTNPSLLATGL